MFGSRHFTLRLSVAIQFQGNAFTQPTGHLLVVHILIFPRKTEWNYPTTVEYELFCGEQQRSNAQTKQAAEGFLITHENFIAQATASHCQHFTVQ